MPEVAVSWTKEADQDLGSQNLKLTEQLAQTCEPILIQNIVQVVYLWLRCSEN